jgi:eight-cysteine-cluster-containing protein
LQTGCSGQICASQEVITTCEFREEYACYQDPAITTCGCNAGQCGFAPTPELAACLEEAGASP